MTSTFADRWHIKIRPNRRELNQIEKVSESTAQRLEKQFQEGVQVGNSVVIHYVSGVHVRGSLFSLVRLSDSEMRSYTR